MINSLSVGLWSKKFNLVRSHWWWRRILSWRRYLPTLKCHPNLGKRTVSRSKLSHNMNHIALIPISSWNTLKLLTSRINCSHLSGNSMLTTKSTWKPSNKRPSRLTSPLSTPMPILWSLSVKVWSILLVWPLTSRKIIVSMQQEQCSNWGVSLNLSMKRPGNATYRTSSWMAMCTKHSCYPRPPSSLLRIKNLPEVI